MHDRQGDTVSDSVPIPICPSSCLVLDPNFQSLSFKAHYQAKPLSTAHAVMLNLTLSQSPLHPKWMTKCTIQSPDLGGFCSPLSSKVTP